MFSKSVLLFGFLFSSNLSFAASVHGLIELESKRRLSNAETELAIIFFRPAVSPDTPISRIPSDPVVMEMRMKAFNPTVKVVQSGTTVSFPNADRVIHNAFSTTRKNKFDLGFYPQSESRSHRFEEAGLVKVFCNVHQNMYGYVMVLDTPYFTQANPDGSFVIDDVPEGLGKIFVWHPRGKTTSQVLEVRGDSTRFETSISLTKRQVPRHKNKFGKPYRRSKDY